MKRAMLFLAFLGVVAAAVYWDGRGRNTILTGESASERTSPAVRASMSRDEGAPSPKSSRAQKPAAASDTKLTEPAATSGAGLTQATALRRQVENDQALPAPGEIIADKVPLSKVPPGAVLEILEPVAIPKCTQRLIFDFAGKQAGGQFLCSGERNQIPGFGRFVRFSNKPSCELVTSRVPINSPVVIEKGRLIPIARTLPPEENGRGIYLGFDDDPIIMMIRCSGGSDSADQMVSNGDLLTAFGRKFRIKMPAQPESRNPGEPAN